MIFQRNKTAAATPVAPGAITLVSVDTPPANASNEVDVGFLLDAFGQVLSAYSQSAFDLPGRSAAELLAELDPWRRHAMLGMPAGNEAGGAIGDRNFGSAARAFAEARRTEKRLVEAALNDLRDCLFTCVNRVHAAVQTGLEADVATVTQMKRVEQAIQGLEEGAVKDEVMLAINSIEHIARTRRDQQQASFGAMAERVRLLGRELEEARRDSETDSLTGLGNRKRFEIAVERALQLHAISRTPLSMLMMDLDGLKKLNDTLGHSAGDRALTLFANTLSKTFLHDSDELCRLGGDEFVVLLPATKQELAARLAHRLIDNVAALTPADAAPDSPRFGVSIGYSELRSGESVSAWMARTDAALYQAKANGRGRAVLA